MKRSYALKGKLSPSFFFTDFKGSVRSIGTSEISADTVDYGNASEPA